MNMNYRNIIWIWPEVSYTQGKWKSKGSGKGKGSGYILPFHSLLEIWLCSCDSKILPFWKELNQKEKIQLWNWYLDFDKNERSEESEKENIFNNDFK